MAELAVICARRSDIFCRSELRRGVQRCVRHGGERYHRFSKVGTVLPHLGRLETEGSEERTIADGLKRLRPIRGGRSRVRVPCRRPGRQERWWLRTEEIQDGNELEGRLAGELSSGY